MKVEHEWVKSLFLLGRIRDIFSPTILYCYGVISYAEAQLNAPQHQAELT